MSASEHVSELEIEIEHSPKLLALIVDDDDDFRVSVAALAKREGFETRTVGRRAGRPVRRRRDLPSRSVRDAAAG